MDELGALDLVILGTAGVSVVLGALRGFVREAASLVVWLVAFIVANLAARDAARLFTDWIADAELRFPLAFAAVFVATLVAGSLFVRLLGMIVSATGLTGLDRTLGVLFGTARAAVLLVVVAAFAAPLFGDTGWWQASRLVPLLLEAQESTFALLESAAASVGTWIRGGGPG